MKKNDVERVEHMKETRNISKILRKRPRSR
jgi:hypothetical protein